jgi:phosphoribosylformimino-5-aminoimidazole carboxamide ribotide isomerase
MREGCFRPCIDIHAGKVKQIVGGSLADEVAEENFISEYDSAYYANLYKSYNITGGHVIALDRMPETYRQAVSALRTFKGGLQYGGGVTPDNAQSFLDAGASQVIVTSYIFQDGQINNENLKKLANTVLPEKLVFDLSVRRKNTSYYITTDRWQKVTDQRLEDVLYLSEYASEFLVHAADVEGKCSGIERGLADLLYEIYVKSGITVTYAGGIKDLDEAKMLSEKGIDFTIGSALDIFGGNIDFSELIKNFG